MRFSTRISGVGGGYQNSLPKFLNSNLNGLFTKRLVHTGMLNFNSDGYAIIPQDIIPYIEGYSLFIAFMGNWFSPSPIQSFSIMGLAQCVLGTPSMSLQDLEIHLIYIKSSCIS